ncbi:CrcB-like protein, Camphor Resistance (CrcB), putative [Angomonas deanei]|uniref:CrcB-like protein, Camphor Resistance (CrcB), putative n=1 Tax=Angomonas deanei TaxID=59799 RepID=A0A7G2C463_9TRYP|nr:CrcB-like protein, Camphor Resistance (CrcB), putative [Angomonas deanei]
MEQEEEEIHSPVGATTPDGDDGASSAPEKPASFYEECKSKVSLTLLLSVLSVACASMAGNAARLALHTAFLSIPFFSTYEFFGPNCIGSFAISFFNSLLPKEADLPLVVRAISVGFCGSFTTWSSWVVDVTNKDSAGGAFEELLSGITMPFVFCVWGLDFGLFLHQQGKRFCCSAETASKWLRMVDIAFLSVSIAAAIAIPIGIQVTVNQGKIDTISSRDIKAVAIGPAGAVVRFLLSVFLNKREQWHSFPVGTLLANVLGTFLVVFMDNYSHARPHNAWFWIVQNGICGALSTVSSFVNECVGFKKAGKDRLMYLYALATLASTVTIAAIGRRSNYN